MSEVQRWLIQKTPIGTMMKPNPDGNWIAGEDFDRVTAERDALQALLTAAEDELDAALRQVKANWDYAQDRQQRLTAADERADVLEGLIGEVLDAVGREPLDLDAVLRLRARMRAALKPAEAPRNQCDGCQAGIPLINGTHRMGREGGYPDFMGCSAKLYKPAEGGGDVARLALRPENQRITPARFKCLACGEYHEGSGNLPCPSMSPYSRIEQ